MQAVPLKRGCATSVALLIFPPAMSTDHALLLRAKKLERCAIEAIFAENYPAVCRMALGLSGRVDVGMSVVRFVVKQALHALPAWKDEDAPQRWFLHHT